VTGGPGHRRRRARHSAAPPGFLVEECHADYLVTIKGNQPKLRQAIAARLTSRDQLAKRQKAFHRDGCAKGTPRFFGTSSEEGKISTIALAHHADDQVELFFIRLLRGSGGEGLAGMKWRNPFPGCVKGIELVRPLLGESKSALREYAAANEIKFREDATNASIRYPAQSHSP